METSRIRNEIESEVDRWINLQKRNEFSVVISSRAMRLLVELIENIDEDRSNYWRQEEYNINRSQERAISLVPNVLNDVFRNNRYERVARNSTFTITTWELLHRMSSILRKWCFIPKDI